MTKKALRTALAGLVAALAVVAWPATGAHGEPKGAAVTVEVTTATQGQWVQVKGTGWGNVGQVVEVVLCGNAALDGSPDCDLASTAEAAVRDGGNFVTAVQVHLPPAPCPCVVRVTGRDTSSDIVVPLTVLGAPTAPPRSHVVQRRAVTLSGVHMAGRGSWTEWFGARPRRVLVFSVTNSGDVPLHDPTVEVSWGRGRHPSGYASPPEVGDLKVHETKTFRVDIPMNELSIGSYDAVVNVDPLGPVVSSRAATVITPVGLAAPPILGCLAVVGTTARRRRRGPRHAPSLPVPQTAPPAPTASAPEPGWYPDPTGVAELRLWDGVAWADETLGSPVEEPAAVATGPEPGWYADPLQPQLLRLWDGSTWTDETRPHPANV